MKKRAHDVLRIYLLFTWIFIALPLFATPSELLTFSGNFTQEGEPYDGTAVTTFTLYDNATSNEDINILWSEVHDLIIEAGEFQVVLGEIEALPYDLGNHPQIFLGVQIGSDDEMVPRLEITAVPYAFGAHTAVTAQNVGTHTIESLDALEETVSNLNSLATADLSACSENQMAAYVPSLNSWVCITLPSAPEETDPTVNTLAKSIFDCDVNQVAKHNGAGLWYCADDLGLTQEEDPSVGPNEINFIPKWNGTQLVQSALYEDVGGDIGIGTNAPPK